MPRSDTRTLLSRQITSIVAIFLIFTGISISFGQNNIVAGQVVRTDSPRQTFVSFLTLSRELEMALLDYRSNRTEVVRTRISRIGDDFLSLIDLSSVPEEWRRKQGVETGSFLLDIFGRISLPEPGAVPSAESFDSTDGPAKWRIPNTPIEIVRIREGPRQGEFLFSGRAVDRAPLFYKEIRNLPLKSQLQIKSWNAFLPQLTGPMIPAGLVVALPEVLKRPWFGTPAWKILFVFVLAVLVAIPVILCNRFITTGADRDTPVVILRRMINPIVIIVATNLLQSFVASEINIAGAFATFFAALVTLVKFTTAAWMFWLLALIVVEFVIRSPKIPDQSLDASLLRLSGRVLGIVGAAAILAYAANILGLPVLSLIAGLGIGGLAVALAVRPTLENLIGGIILYADRPVRVGDYCKFKEHLGIVEKIGVRSTQIRGLDRTIISVPNAKFADMEIINWAHCDKMLIHTLIGLRYETEPDQLRFVLAQMREMFCAHPKIDSSTVRVRFAGYGESSLDIDVRVFALACEWNEFYAIREDVYLRVNDIVTQSGSGFAFPSRTLYFGRDEGLNQEHSEQASKEVDSWRRAGKLPFPNMPQSRLNELANTLDYPPTGSVEASSKDVQETERAESLSIEPEEQDEVARKSSTGSESTPISKTKSRSKGSKNG
jgi:MscS family membrane protein